MTPFDAAIEELRQRGLIRSLREIGSPQGPTVTIDGREVVCLCSNNYLGLAGDPALAVAAQEAIGRWGWGAGASRLISGDMSPHRRLERAMAGFLGTESSLLFGNGTMANIGALDALAGRGDHLVCDELNHASLIDGARLSRATTHIFPHRDYEAAERILSGLPSGSRRIIVTDSVFSMDGDLADLPRLVALKEKHGALLYVDDAHGLGVLGASGAGAVEHFGLQGRVDIHMVTLGKSLGGYGAVIAGSRQLTEFLLNRARTFIYTTAPPPAMAEAALAALEIMRSQPDRRQQLWSNLNQFADGLRGQGWKVGQPESAVIPIVIGDVERTMKMATALFEKGVLAVGIRPPTVPEGGSRIRCTLMSTHTDAHIEKALAAFAQCRTFAA